MGDAQVLGYERVLGAHVVVEGYFWEGVQAGVRGGGGLRVAEEGGDDDEVF